MDIWYKLWRVIVRRSYSFLTNGAIIRGHENYRPGPKIIIINHPSATDYFLFPHIFPDRFSYVLDRDIFFLPILGWLHRKAGHIPVGNGNASKTIDIAVDAQGRRSSKTIELARRRLTEGSSVVMPLEGRLSPKIGFSRPRVGPALLSLEEQVPIIPCGIYVPQASLKRIRFKLFGRERVGIMQLGGRCVVQVGEAWMPTGKVERHYDWKTLYEVSQNLMIRVSALVERARAYDASQSALQNLEQARLVER